MSDLFGGGLLLAQTGEAVSSFGWLGLISRVLHILAAIAIVGGSIYQRLVLLPGLREWEQQKVDDLYAGMRRRWSLLVAVSVAFLLFSGLYNFVVIVKNYELPRYYHPLFGVKFLLAFFVFFVASILAGRTALAQRFRQNLSMWLTVNLVVAILIVAIGGVLKVGEKTPKAVTEPAPNYMSDR